MPLAIDLTAANRNETTFLETIVDEVEPIRTPNGGRRKRPDKLHADKGYDSASNREVLRERHITPRIARRGIDSSERLGRYRWVVERTLAWLNRYRRLRVRYERDASIHRAFLFLGCALICFHQLESRLC